MGWNDVLAASIGAGGPVLVAEVARLGGVSERAVRERAHREAWWRPYPDVVAAPGTPRDGRARVLAAALHARGRTGDPVRDVAAVTRDSALALLGIQRTYPSVATIVIPRERWLSSRSGLTIVRSAALQPDDVVEHDGVPAVVGMALVRDLAAVRTRAGLRRALIDLAHAGHIDLRTLQSELAAARRFVGVAVARAAVADLLSAGRSDSPLEYEVRDGLRGEGIELDRGQVPVPGTRIHLDLGIAAIRFGIEVDSFGHHGSRTDLDRDAGRSNAVAATGDGWQVLRATWSILGTRFAPFVRQVQNVIAMQALRHLGLPWPPPEVLR